MYSEFGQLVLNSLGAVLLGIAVLVASSLIAGYRDFSRDDMLQFALSVIGCVLIVMGLLGCCMVVAAPVSPILVVIGPFVIAELVSKRHRARQQALLWVLAAAAERYIPLVPAVEAFARQGRGWFAQRVRWLAGSLADGVALPDALGQIRGLIHRETLPILCVGHASGALAAALRQAATIRQSRNRQWLMLAGKIEYLCAVVCVGVSIMTFVMMKIVPEFYKIFTDFDAELPRLTVALIDVSSFLIEDFIFPPLLLVVLLLLIICLDLRFTGWICWAGLPGFHWIALRFQSAGILEALALAAGQRYPLYQAIDVLSRTHHLTLVRRRLHKALRDTQAGTDWCDSLRRQGLIRAADRAVLQAAQRAGNLPWALQEMADSSRRRLGYRLYALVQLAYPPVIIALGAMVMFFVVGLFIPLIRLVQTLT